MNQDYASPMMAMNGNGGMMEIELPWEIVKYESDLVFWIGTKCYYCKCQGGINQQEELSCENILSKINTFIEEKMN